MKKINLLIILCLLAVMLPLNVAANTFTNEGKQYKITKADAACTQFEYIASGEDATVIYADENTGEIWSLSSDNTCRLMTRTEIINNQDKYTYISYNVDFNTDGTATIYRSKVYLFIRQSLIKSTTYQDDKQYYINNNGSYEEVVTSDESELDKYYEYAFFRLALYDENSNETYYKESNDPEVFEQATNPETVQLGELYILSPREDVIFDEVKKLDNKLNTALEQITAEYIEVIATPTEKAFYFIVHMDDTGSNVNIYDESGNLLYEGVTSFTTALDELHIVYKDNKAYFYDLNQNPIHETSVFSKNVYESAQVNNVSLLSFNGQETYFISSEVMSPSTTNPDTADGITTAIISIIVASALLFGIIKFQTKKIY